MRVNAEWCRNDDVTLRAQQPAGFPKDLIRTRKVLQQFAKQDSVKAFIGKRQRVPSHQLKVHILLDVVRLLIEFTQGVTDHTLIHIHADHPVAFPPKQ